MPGKTPDTGRNKKLHAPPRRGFPLRRSPCWRLWPALVAVLLAVALPIAVVVSPPPASAQVSTVTLYVSSSGSNTNNDGCIATNPCLTIPYAVGQATSADDGDAVTIEVLAAAQPYEETTYINAEALASLTIEGAGASTTAVDGEDRGTVFTIGTGTVAISGLTISGGANYGGGGVINDAEATLTDDTFTDDEAGLGGGVNNNFGTAVIADDTFTDDGDAQGTGFFNQGTATLTDDTFTDDSGETIDDYAGALTLDDDTFSDDGYPEGGVLVAGSNTGSTTASPPPAIADSLFADNMGYNCSGPVNDMGYNVADNTQCFSPGSTSIERSDSLIGPLSLAANGSTGPETEAIGTTSAAFEEVPLVDGKCAGGDATDERGEPRPGFPGQGCDAGAFELQAVPSSISTIVDDATTNEAWGTGEVAGSSASDTATITGQQGLIPTGTVTYSLFDNGGCSTANGQPTTDTVDVDRETGAVPTSTPGSGPLTVGSYSFEAAYTPATGSTYLPSNGSCEPFVVVQDPTTTVIRSELSPSTSGESVTFAASVTANEPGSGTPSGQITTALTNASGAEVSFTCESGSDTVTLTNAKADCTVPAGTLSVSGEPYTVTASYSGDTNYYASSGSTDQPLVYASVALTKAVSSATPGVGSEDAFTLSAHNSASSSADSGEVVVVDRLPSGLDYLSSVAGAGSVVDSGATVTWTIPDLSPGATASLRIVVRVETTAKADNTASFTQTTPDSTGGTTGRSNSVEITPSYAILGVTEKVADPAPTVGSGDRFTTVVTDKGPDGAAGVMVSDPLPAGVTIVSEGTTEGTVREQSVDGVETLEWDIGSLAVGASAALDVAVTVTASSGSIVNQVTATDSTFDPEGQAKHASVSAVVTPPTVIPPTHTGEPWSGWSYRLLVLLAGLCGIALLEVARRRRDPILDVRLDSLERRRRTRRVGP